MASMFSPPHPGELLSEWIEGLDGMNITQFAKAIHITRAQLSRIIHGHAAITPEIAVRLELALGTSSAMWIGMQGEYDVWQARQSERPAIQQISQPVVEAVEAIYA
ncbi:HigA family addiction module antitoxin [Chromobacterium aquaticum]|uniref:HigA family addiction module antitoxin n=1 Tax=Chromobacterium aquaticum TaxID=467180 RepID=A0ABV8ZYQ2_9NEIS|nr:HigA family addiction module antitoxin [Chromobacterium aquaticum]MCD5363551.1 HigA family addiction module antitoxin [Chromobacterium aquaticum]RBH51572.1 addiction module antidote protein, HigA family [Pseudomonas sp. MWU13-2860]